MSNSGGFFFSPVNGGSPFANLGPAAEVAYHPMAPDDEVADANKEVMKTYGGEAASPDLLAMMGQWVQLQHAERVASRMVAKALQMTNPGADDPKARTTPLLQGLGGGSGGLYIPKQGLPFVALKALARRIEVTQAIHRTRKRQLLAFAEPSPKDDIPGWKLVAADPNADLSEDHHAYLSWLTNFLVCGGREFDALERRRLGREGLPTALRKLSDDSFSYDHVAFETVPLRGANGLDAFWVRDSSTFYLGNRSEQGPDSVGGNAYLIQEVQSGQLVTFDYDEAFLFQRNPSTDLEWCGYGTSELESSIETIGNFLQACAYTREGIDNNAIPRGILVLGGNYDSTTMQAFQTAWQAKIRGVGNSFALPMLNSRGQQATAQFVQTGQPFSEMAFAKWIQLQTAICCSIYGIDPAEIGMESFTAGKSSLSGDDTAERLAAAKDKGFCPFLQDISGMLSNDVLARFAPWVRHKFTGLNPGDEKWKAQERARLSTIDEARLGMGMKKHPIASIGALPADSGILQAEFQRYSATLTLDEARQCWVGLPGLADSKLGATLLNPSLQAAQQGAMNPQQEEGMGPGGPEGFQPGGDGGEDGPEAPEGAGAPPKGFGGEVSDRLHALNGGSEDE